MKTLTIILMLFNIHLYANNRIDLSKHIEDQSGLLTYTFEKRMERYLEHFYQSSEIKLQVVFLQTLQGKNVEDFNLDLLNRYDPSERVILFTLSLSDRLFNIARSENLSDEVSIARVSNMIEMLLPYIKAKKFEHSVSIFSDMAIFTVDSDYELSPPPVTQKQFVGTKGLIFFLVIFILVIMLGRKLFNSSILFTSNQNKFKRKQISGGW